MREACLEVVGQLVAVGFVGNDLAVPGDVVSAVEQGAEGVLTSHADDVSVVVV